MPHHRLPHHRLPHHRLPHHRLQRGPRGQRIVKAKAVAKGAHRIGQRLADHDVLPSHRQHHHQTERRTSRAQPQRLRNRHRHQHMRAVDASHAEQITTLRPALQMQQIKLQPFFGGKAQLERDDQRSGVDQRHIAQTQPVERHVKSPAAITSCCAISATRRF
jgi:hypothetical protein